MMLVEHLNGRMLDAEISNIRLRVLVVKLSPILKQIDRVISEIVLLAYQLVLSIL